MKTFDYVLIAFLILFVVLAIMNLRKRKSKCGDCSSCIGCDQFSHCDLPNKENECVKITDEQDGK